MTGRSDEEFAKEAFALFLREGRPSRQQNWHDVPRGKDPPDYWLTFGSAKFAMEVTTFTTNYMSSGKKEGLSSIGVASLIRRFDQEVTDAAKAKNHLNGCYVVDFHEPFDDLDKHLDQLKRHAIDFITTTVNAEQTSEKVINVPNAPRCRIRKVHRDKSYVASIILSDAKFEGEVREELFKLIATCVNRKAHALRQVTGSKILLLLDRYYVAESDDFPDEFGSLPAINSFHAVFIVDYRGRAHPIWPSRRSEDVLNHLEKDAAN